VRYLVFPGRDRIRRGAFVERSLLPVSAACVVANAIRECLATLSRSDVDLRLWPPAVPSGDGWDAILRGASVYVVRGTLADAALVLRPRDANALAAWLFGEPVAPEGDRALSPLESEITRRAVAAIAPTLSPVCGETRLEGRSGIDAVTYFELHVVTPVECCIGIALSREPASALAKRLERDVLKNAAIVASVELSLPPLSAERVAMLRAGDVIDAGGSAGLLRANGVPYARGGSGVAGERFAMRVGSFV